MAQKKEEKKTPKMMFPGVRVEGQKYSQLHLNWELFGNTQILAALRLVVSTGTHSIIEGPMFNH